MNEDKQTIAVRKAFLDFNSISTSLKVFLDYFMKKQAKIRLLSTKEL